MCDCDLYDDILCVDGRRERELSLSHIIIVDLSSWLLLTTIGLVVVTNAYKIELLLS